MTITLKTGTRPIQLGTVTDLKFNRVERDGSVDIPLARGASRQGLGKPIGAVLSLAGTFVGDTRFDYFQQFDRIRMIGRSLKLESNHLATIVYLNNVSLGKVVGDFLGYNLALKESLFKSISDCEDQVGWYADSGDLTNEYDSPEPKEGDFYLKNNIVNGDYFELDFEPSDPVDPAQWSTLLSGFKLAQSPTSTRLQYASTMTMSIVTLTFRVSFFCPMCGIACLFIRASSRISRPTTLAGFINSVLN